MCDLWKNRVFFSIFSFRCCVLQVPWMSFRRCCNANSTRNFYQMSQRRPGQWGISFVCENTWRNTKGCGAERVQSFTLFHFWFIWKLQYVCFSGWCSLGFSFCCLLVLKLSTSFCIILKRFSLQQSKSWNDRQRSELDLRRCGRKNVATVLEMSHQNLYCRGFICFLEPYEHLSMVCNLLL